MRCHLLGTKVGIPYLSSYESACGTATNISWALRERERGYILKPFSVSVPVLIPIQFGFLPYYNRNVDLHLRYLQCILHMSEDWNGINLVQISFVRSADFCFGMAF